MFCVYIMSNLNLIINSDAIDDLNEQVGLVNLGNNRFVPAINIILAKQWVRPPHDSFRPTAPPKP